MRAFRTLEGGFCKMLNQSRPLQYNFDSAIIYNQNGSLGRIACLSSFYCNLLAGIVWQINFLFNHR